MTKKQQLIMGLTRNELIDIKNSFIFAKWYKQTLDLDPCFRVHSKTESDVAIIHINNDIAVALEEGWTKWPAAELKKFTNAIKKGTIQEIKHLKDCNCIENRPIPFMINIMNSYRFFIDDKQWTDVTKKQRLAMDNDDKELKKYAKKYVKLCEKLWKWIDIPGWNKKYWKIIQSKN